MGFAPADDPQIVVYVAIDNPKGTVQFGGVVAAPIAGKIISDSLQALGVEKRTNGLEKEYRWGDKQLLEVPNLIGKTKREIAESYFNFKLDVNGDGEVVIEQGPDPGVKKEPGQTIRIYLGDKSEIND